MRHLAHLTDLSRPALRLRALFQPGQLLEGDDNLDKILVHKFFKSTEVNSRLTARSESVLETPLSLVRPRARGRESVVPWECA